MSAQPLQIFNVFSKAFGLTNHSAYRKGLRKCKNPDVFTDYTSIDYKEDFGLIEESFCDCGCKSSIYVKKVGNMDERYTEIKTQVEYEKLPNKPKPTPFQVKLESDIMRANREEEELGIIHDQDSCSFILVPEFEYRNTF